MLTTKSRVIRVPVLLRREQWGRGGSESRRRAPGRKGGSCPTVAPPASHCGVGDGEKLGDALGKSRVCAVAVQRARSGGWQQPSPGLSLNEAGIGMNSRSGAHGSAGGPPVSSNWSAPNGITQGLMPPSPRATKYILLQGSAGWH